MAAIDPLLEAALKNQVELVLLEPGQLPRFRVAGSDHEVTQTVLDAAAIARLLAEIAPGGHAPDPASEPRWEFDYRSNGRLFHFACLGGPAGWTASATAVTEVASRRAPEPDPLAARRRPLPSVETLLRSLVDLGASDLHLAAWSVPRFRLHGVFEALESYAAPTSAQLKERLFELAPERARDEFERQSSASFTHEVEGLARFRIALTRDRQGVGATIRRLPATAPDADALDLPTTVRGFAAAERGLVLVSGGPGSGRSSTFAALVALAAGAGPRHVVTIEQPIEHAIEPVRGLVRQREVPTHSPSFAAALAETARLDVEVLGLGSLPDRATVAAAVERAAAGHLVLVVLDGASVPIALGAVLAALAADGGGRAGARLAEVFAGASAQRLLPRPNGGRVAVWEIAPPLPAIVEAISQELLWQVPALLDAAWIDGARSAAAGLAERVADGSLEEARARRLAGNSQTLDERLRALGLDAPFGAPGRRPS